MKMGDGRENSGKDEEFWGEMRKFGETMSKIDRIISMDTASQTVRINVLYIYLFIR